MRKFHEQAGQVVFAFGRFNPPTIGHEKLMDKTKQIAGSSRYIIYPSQSQNQKKDPLPFALKVAYMRKMFPTHARNIIADKSIRNVFDIAVKLYDEKYTDIAMVAGSDRVKEFKKLLDTYNGVTGKRHGFYKFRTISVINAGERDPDAEGVTGMSASKMRASASLGDLESFKLGLPKGFKDAEKLFKDVRKYMNIREERDMGLMTDYEELRDAYLTGDVWNIDDLIEARGITGKIIRRGTNYVSFVDEENKVHKAWLHEINVNENPLKMFKGGLLDPSPILKKLMGRLNPKLIANIVKKYVDGINKGEHKGGSSIDGGLKSKNRLIHDIVMQYGLERKYGIGARGIRKIINRLVDKGKLDRKYQVEVKQDPDVKGSKGTEPAKYYAKDAEGDEMSVSTKRKRDAHFAKKKKGPAPGDATAKTRPSTHTSKFKQMYGEKLGKNADMGDYIDDFKNSDSPQFKGKSKEKRKEMAIAAYLSRNEEMELNEKIEALVNKAKKTGMPYGILKKVYDRGMAAYKTGHRPGATAQQWALARVNSFTTKSSGTWGKADKDLADKVRASEEVELDEKYDSDKFFDGKGTPEQRLQLLKLTNKALRTLGGSPKQNAIKKEIDALRKKMGMKVKEEVKKDKKEEIKEWFESNVTRAKYQMHHGDDWWWKLNEVHDKMLEKNGDCCEDCINEEEMPCPPATKDVKLNTKNRDLTVKNHMYGPLNVDEPGDYWEKIAKKWDTTTEAAKKSLCGNCVAFDISPRMKECMPGETSDGDGELGYCYMHHFKCHSARSCETWAKGGPITTDEKSYDWQSKNEDLKEKGPGLWANIHKKRKEGRPMRKKGEKGAPTQDQIKKAQDASEGLQKFNQFVLRNHWGEITEKSEYQGRPVELNNPTKGDTKKYKVYVKNDKGNVVKVEYGDPNMSIKRDDPEKRKSFRARHNCENPGPKWKARYWSCKFWSTKSVTDLMKG